MPISNPIITLTTERSPIVLAESDPISAPIERGIFWLNTLNRKLWIAIATDLTSDWQAIGADTPQIDPASILNKILVQNGQVLTTDNHVIFED